MYKQPYLELNDLYTRIKSGEAQKETKAKMKALGERERKRLESSTEETTQEPNPMFSIASRFMQVKEDNEKIKASLNEEPIGPRGEGIDTRALYTVDEEEYEGPEGMDGFLAIMDKHEGAGNYDTLYAHEQREGGRFSGVKVTEMTIGELKEFADNEYRPYMRKAHGENASPMGRYQFVGDTLEAVAKEMGLSDDTKFTPQVQDAMFEYYLDKRISSAGTLDKQVQAVRNAWAGFKNVPTSTLKSLIRDRLETKKPQPRGLGSKRT